MSDENQNTELPDKYKSPEFIEYLKQQGKSPEAVWNGGAGASDLDKIFGEYKTQNEEGSLAGERNNQNQRRGQNRDNQRRNGNQRNGDQNLGVGQRKDQNQHVSQNKTETQNTDWIKDKRDSWQPWCEKEHTPAYVYDEDKEFKSGLKFDVYKTPEDKAAGKKAATIQYNSPKDVVIEDTPDYEFFSKLTKEAKKDQVPGVTFDGEMTPDFKARLAAACLENNLPMEKGPDYIDVNLLGNNISDDLKAKVEAFNKEQEYKKLYEQTKQNAEALAKQNEGKTPKDEGYTAFTLDEKDPTTAAIQYAAYRNAGVQVKNAYDATKENKGYFPVDNLGFMSEEEKKPLTEYNAKQDNINAVRDKAHKHLEDVLKNGTEEEKKAAQERLDVEAARQAKREGKTLTEEQTNLLGKKRAAIQNREDVSVERTNSKGEKETVTSKKMDYKWINDMRNGRI